MTNNRRARSTFSQRKKWLSEHPELQKADRKTIIAAMKKAGLVAPTTYASDVRIWQEEGPDKP